MKKNIFRNFMLALCLIISGTFFAGCGEQFIEEREYSLINMQVIQDNTPSFYTRFEDGSFSGVFIGGMEISDCKIQVGRETSTLTYDDSENSGIVATFKFSVYTDSSVYPSYSLSDYSITLNGKDCILITESEKQELFEDNAALLDEVVQFSYILNYGNTSLQLVTQNKTFSCHVVVSDKSDSSLVFLAIVYGF